MGDFRDEILNEYLISLNEKKIMFHFNKKNLI